MKRGALHWVELDKRRPAIIISPEVRNVHASDVIIIPCSASTRPMTWHVRLEKGEAGLAAASFAKCEQVVTMAKDWIDPKPLGMLSAAKLREVERALLSALGMQLA
ncbi:MAG: type II toxin-antitoxin system PemK/MazF family toxin [Deltaproteobacteria bacterium]|nr:type II toxin-antitoxin system PemK/MazF family toxin [Deltaproteobacteria bacterium]